MAGGPLQGVIHHLRGLAAAGPSDGELLERFLVGRDESAFEALLRRHGPMVWRVCRRVLQDPHDAEDAFQATFLVFVRRAGSIARRELLGNWLYGVAFHTARAARAAAGRRRAKEAKAVPRPRPPDEGDWSDLLPLLDEELSQLPDKYRAAVVLCDLEGKSRQEAARQLGLAAGTLSSRLARARSLLAGRLARRGVTVAGGALAVALGRQAAAALPPSPIVSTIQAGTLVLAGQAVTAGGVPARVAALTEGALRAMFLSKLKTATAVLFVGSALALGLGQVASDRLGAQTGAPPPRAPAAGEAVVRYALKYADAAAVAEALTRAGRARAGDPEVRVAEVDERTNSLIVGGEPEEVERLLKMARQLDQAAAERARRDDWGNGAGRARGPESLPERVARLEKELHEVQDRLKRLEKQRGETQAERIREKIDEQIRQTLPQKK